MDDFNEEIREILFNKFQKKAQEEFEWRQYLKEKEYKEKIYKRIQQDVQFSSKYVRNGMSRQTGEKCKFYDIELANHPTIQIYEQKLFNEYNRYHKYLGRSLNITTYCYLMKEIAFNEYVLLWYIPGLEYAYEEYLKENFYGKEKSNRYENWKEYQIDWFDEVFKADEKIQTSFQKWLEEFGNTYRNHYVNISEIKFENWEYAWVDYIRINSMKNFYYHCSEIIRNPKDFDYIADIDEYLKEAEKILHKKLR